LELLKYFDQVKVMNIFYVHKYFNENLPCDTLATLKFEKTNHSIGTRGNAIGLINRSNVKSTNFGLHSLTGLSSFQNMNLSELNLASHCPPTFT